MRLLCLHCILRKEEAMEGQIYTVSEVNGFIKNVIDGIPQLSGIYIRGSCPTIRYTPPGITTSP